MPFEMVRRLRDAVRSKRPEKRTTTFGFSFITMLQHTGRFLLNFSLQRTT